MGLAVIGAGLGRTGTLSLKHALEQLGFAPCYHMVEVLFSPQREVRIAQWNAITSGATPDWDAVFAGFRATVDWPACNYYAELLARWPDAKVVLTQRRDAGQWFDSAQSTILSPGLGHGDFVTRLFHDKLGPDLHDRAAGSGRTSGTMRRCARMSPLQGCSNSRPTTGGSRYAPFSASRSPIRPTRASTRPPISRR